MSTIPKAVEDNIKLCYDISNDKLSPVTREVFYAKIKETGEHYMPTNYDCFVAGYRCYQLATDGREELEKANQQLQEDYDIQNYKYTEAVVSITALQSSLKEKEKECEELKVLGNDCVKTINQQTKELQELKAENERLSGLLVSLSNGEAMNVVRESDGVYSVIFKTPNK